MVKWDEVDPIKGIDTLQRNGQVRILGMDEEITVEEIEKMSTDQVRERLGTSIIQFFVTYLDGSNTAPICFFARNKSNDFGEFMSDKLQLIFSKLQKGQQLKVVATSSDGDPGNERVVSFLEKTYPEIVHLYDVDHIVKNLRNNLLRNTLKVDGISISVNSLVKAQSLIQHLGLKFSSIKPQNILKWKPVKDLMTINLKLLKQHQDLEMKALGNYIGFMKKIYSSFHNNTIRWSTRQAKLTKCYNYFSRVVNLSNETKGHIKTSVNNISKLIDNMTGDYSIMFSSLGTIMIENFFSIVRHKQQYFTIADYCQLFSKAWYIMQLTFSDEKERGFKLPVQTMGKNYGDIQGLKFSPPKLQKRSKITHTLIRISDCAQKLLDTFSPQPGQVTIAQSHRTQTPIFIQCPVTCCKHRHLYSNIGHLVNHMMTCHKEYSSKVEARQHATSLVQKYLTDLAIDSMEQVIDQASSTISDTSDQPLPDNSIEPASTASPVMNQIHVLLNRTGERDDENSQPPQSSKLVSTAVSKRKVLESCSKCTKPRNSQCLSLLCKKCCESSNTQCRVHKMKDASPTQTKKSIRIDPEVLDDCREKGQLKIFIVDFEYSDSKVKGLTDCFVYDVLKSEGWGQDTEFIMPRNGMVSSNISSHMPGSITTSMLYASAKEKGIISESDFFSTFIERTCCKSGATIIAGHNCATERDVIEQAMVAHNRFYHDQFLVFVNTIDIVKSKLVLDKYGLNDVFSCLYGSDIVNAHRALSDVEALKKVLDHQKNSW